MCGAVAKCRAVVCLPRVCLTPVWVTVCPLPSALVYTSVCTLPYVLGWAYVFRLLCDLSFAFRPLCGFNFSDMLPLRSAMLCLSRVYLTPSVGDCVSPALVHACVCALPAGTRIWIGLF